MLELFTRPEQFIIAVGVFVSVGAYIFSHRIENKNRIIKLRAFTIVSLCVISTYVFSIIGYSIYAVESTLYAQSTISVVGKFAYLAGFIIEFILFFSSYLSGDKRLEFDRPTKVEILLDLIFLASVLVAVTVFTENISYILKFFIGELSVSDIRTALIPALTAIIAAKIVDLSLRWSLFEVQ